ncbi:MAG: protein kinase domain-containing protein, partial [Planctomycetota bacterium]
KVIKPGMDSKQILARFEAERQALALLDHPNIAHIFDAGTTNAGRPYFVMEYIEGLAVTEHCDAHKLNIEDRLRVFLQICGAVRHAHQKGIIHRDIKPTNILVSMRDGQPLVKIIDFGVARAVSRPLTDRTLNTLQGQVIGTPEYMSPEQADMASPDVDTRSDIYSLGAVLYELLTGTQPFDPQSLRDSGLDNMRRIISEQTPLRPSTRLLRLGDGAKDIADKRCTEAGILVKRLGRELEWIPLKAMRKERAHRYQSASEFGDDIRNYLNGSPLIAGPESVMYRVRKFVSRYRWSVAAALAVLVTLTAGLVVSSALYLRAEQARTNEESQKNIAQSERDRATEAERQARQTLANLYEEQGRKYMESGNLDRALVVLTEAYRIDSSRQSTRFLLSACMSKHENPAVRGGRDLLAWPDKYLAMDDVPFAISPDRRLVALVDRNNGSIEVFDTSTAELKNSFFYEDVVQLTFSPTNNFAVVRLKGDATGHLLKVLDLAAGREVFSTKRANVDIDNIRKLSDDDQSTANLMRDLFSTICMGPDGDWFAFMDLAGSPEQRRQSLKLWDFKSNELYTVAGEGLGSIVKGMMLRPESAYGSSRKLLTLHTDNIVTPWGIPGLEPEQSFAWHADFALLGPRGITYMNFNRGTAALGNRSANSTVRSFENIIAAGYSPDETRVVTQQAGDVVDANDPEDSGPATSLWKVYDGLHVGGMSGPAVGNWHFTPNSNHVITEHDGGQVKVWWAEDGGLLFATGPQENLKVTDISPDSTFLLTCGTGRTRNARVWNLNTSDSSEVYQDKKWRTDMSNGFVFTCLDRIFASSHVPAVQLPRFNADGSRLITESGLRRIGGGIGSPRDVSSLVYAHVPLRLVGGRFRPAPTAEMLLAKWDYHLLADGEGHHETVEAALDAMEYEIESGELQKSGELAKELQSWAPFERQELADRTQDVIRRLSRAYRVRGDAKERQAQYGAAMTDYELAIRFNDEDPDVFNDLAWVQATCPDRQLRDGAEAVENARRACELTDWKHWGYLSTYAIACAEMGNFTDAAGFQAKALDLMPNASRGKWQANFEERLRLFKSKVSYESKPFLQLPGGNLAGWWKLDESTGTTVYDSSGNGRHGRFVGSPNWKKGRIGGAVQCDTTDDYIDISRSPDFDIVDAMTVTAWFQAGNSEKGPAARYLVGRAHCWSVFLGNLTNELTFKCHGLEVPSIYPDFAIKAKKHVDDGQWYHVAAVYDGVSMLLYVDGVLDACESASGAISTNSFPVHIGTDSSLDRRGWLGSIDDVRIYNRALTAVEIAQLHGDTRE